MWDIYVVIKYSDGYVTTPATWCVENFPNYDIAKTLNVKLTIMFFFKRKVGNYVF